MVGANIRRHRRLLGMSQDQVGEAAGITYQQIQKYEKGTNPVTASRLVQIAGALSVPVGTLFEGIDIEDGVAAQSPAAIDDPVRARQAEEFARFWMAIPDPEVRRHIAELAQSLAHDGESDEEATPQEKKSGRAQ